MKSWITHHQQTTNTMLAVAASGALYQAVEWSYGQRSGQDVGNDELLQYCKFSIALTMSELLKRQTSLTESVQTLPYYLNDPYSTMPAVIASVTSMLTKMTTSSAILPRSLRIIGNSCIGLSLSYMMEEIGVPGAMQAMIFTALTNRGFRDDQPSRTDHAMILAPLLQEGLDSLRNISHKNLRELAASLNISQTLIPKIIRLGADEKVTGDKLRKQFFEAGIPQRKLLSTSLLSTFSSTPTTTPTPFTHAINNEDPVVMPYVIAGIGLFIILCCFGFWCCCCHKRKKENRERDDRIAARDHGKWLLTRPDFKRNHHYNQNLPNPPLRCKEVGFRSPLPQQHYYCSVEQLSTIVNSILNPPLIQNPNKPLPQPPQHPNHRNDLWKWVTLLPCVHKKDREAAFTILEHWENSTRQVLREPQMIRIAGEVVHEMIWRSSTLSDHEKRVYDGQLEKINTLRKISTFAITYLSKGKHKSNDRNTQWRQHTLETIHAFQQERKAWKLSTQEKLQEHQGNIDHAQQLIYQHKWQLYEWQNTSTERIALINNTRDWQSLSNQRVAWAKENHSIK